MEERFRFVDEARRGCWGMAELCRAFGIGRKTGQKWLRRYESEGVAGLSDRSRASRTQRHATDEGDRRLIVEARRLRPTWGPKKLRPWLAREHPGIELASLTTMAKILDRAGREQPADGTVRPP